MKKIKIGMIFIAMCISNYICVISENKIALQDIYCGVTYNGRVVFYAVSLLVYMCYSVFIYEEQDDYISNYGILTLTRNKNRINILNTLCIENFKMVMEVEFIKIISFLIMELIVKRKIEFKGINIFLLDMFEFVVAIFIFMFIQMIFEIVLSPNTAIVISAFLFLGSMFFSDLIDRMGVLSGLQYLLFSNAMMNLRKNCFIKNILEHMILICCMLGILFVMYSVSKKYFNERDFI